MRRHHRKLPTCQRLWLYLGPRGGFWAASEGPSSVETLRELVSWGIKCTSTQWLFLVPIKGGRWHIIPQLAVYTTYILPSGRLYATYHLLREPETTIDQLRCNFLFRLIIMMRRTSLWDLFGTTKHVFFLMFPFQLLAPQESFCFIQPPKIQHREAIELYDVLHDLLIFSKTPWSYTTPAQLQNRTPARQKDNTKTTVLHQQNLNKGWWLKRPFSIKILVQSRKMAYSSPTFLGWNWTKDHPGTRSFLMMGEIPSGKLNRHLATFTTKTISCTL